MNRHAIRRNARPLGASVGAGYPLAEAPLRPVVVRCVSPPRDRHVHARTYVCAYDMRVPKKRATRSEANEVQIERRDKRDSRNPLGEPKRSVHELTRPDASRNVILLRRTSRVLGAPRFSPRVTHGRPIVCARCIPFCGQTSSTRVPIRRIDLATRRNAESMQVKNVLLFFFSIFFSLYSFYLIAEDINVERYRKKFRIIVKFNRN